MPGRYPLSGQNKRFGPEMSIKVAESMALRRAFNVSASTVEEQWESAPPAETEPPKTLADRVAERVESIEKGPEPAADPAADPAEAEAAEAVFRAAEALEGETDAGATLGLDNSLNGGRSLPDLAQKKKRGPTPHQRIEPRPRFEQTAFAAA